MTYLWIVLVALFVQSECRRHYGEEDEVKTNCVDKDVDKYLDEVLEKARHDLPDPMRLPPRSTIVDLSDGVLWGMSELQRVGPAEVICDGDDVTIKAKLTVDEMKGRYTWTHERKNKSPRTGYVVIISHDFEADIELVLEKDEEQKTEPRLQKFTIQKFKNTKIEVTGMSYFTWALGEITTLMSGIFQRVIAHAVEGPIKEGLERQLREMRWD